MRRWLGASALFLGACALGVLLAPLPTRWFTPREHRRVLDRQGVLLAERRIPDRGRELWVELDRVDPQVVSALLAAEDRGFYQHLGVSPRAVARALWANLRQGHTVQGGSTITQQTARLLDRRPGGFRGKLIEAVWALRLEAHLSKEEILTWYLNRAYFGQGAWGIEAAALSTFDEHASGLSLAEAALLVGLLPAPERLHPRVDPAAARRARARVLDDMVSTGALTSAEAEQAKLEPVQLRRRGPEEVAPHWVARVLDEDPTEPVLRTTLDADLQREVVALVKEQLAALTSYEVDHAAVIVVENRTGEVRAYVGSGAWGAATGQVDGVRARRSPGSTLKPFLYELAFEQGKLPSDVLPDLPKSWDTRHGSWAPENYSHRFHGPVRAREALACSYNLPAVALLNELGVSSFQSRLQGLGFELPASAAFYGLGLTLGDGEVTLEELARGYAILARGGLDLPLRLRLQEADPQPVRRMEELATWMVGDVLRDPLARVPAFGRRTILARPYPVAVKTGTSSGYRDNWTLGYTEAWTVGVWVGNHDNRSMGRVSGVTGAAPLWASVMDLVTHEEATPPPPPAAMVRRESCSLSGMAPGPYCPRTVVDWVPATSPAGDLCAWHTDTCAVAWPTEYAGWAADAGRLEPEGCSAQGRARVAYPREGAVLYLDPRIPVEAQRVPLRAEAPVGAAVATWTVDGVVIEGPVAEPALWTPRRSGAHRVALQVDGHDAGAVTVEVRGL